MDEPDRRQAAANNLIAVLTRRPVATIDELKAVLQTDVRMTGVWFSYWTNGAESLTTGCGIRA